MVRDHEVEQFVNNHVLANVSVHAQQFGIEVQVAVR